MVANPNVLAVLALPEAERLNYALDIIRSLTEFPADDLAFYRREYGLTGTQAGLMTLLRRRAGQPVRTETLCEAMPGDEKSVATLRVHLLKLRKVLDPQIGTRTVENVWGVGYMVPRAVDALMKKPPAAEPPALVEVRKFTSPSEQTKNRFTYWTSDQLRILRAMGKNGRTVRDIAIAVGRTERGVMDKLKEEGISVVRG